MSLTITEDCEIELLDALEVELKRRSDASNEPDKVYFSGEWDSNLTRFEAASNQLEIGVLSNDRDVALVLLHLVRNIIDHRPDRLLSTVRADYSDHPDTSTTVPMGTIMSRLIEQETTYLSQFALDERITHKLSIYRQRFIIDKRLDEVDLWTMPRVFRAIKDMY